MTVQVDGGRQLPEIVREFDDRGIELSEFALRKASLDEVFLALTGHRAEQAPPEEPGDRQQKLSRSAR